MTIRDEDAFWSPSIVPLHIPALDYHKRTSRMTYAQSAVIRSQALRPHSQRESGMLGSASHLPYQRVWHILPQVRRDGDKAIEMSG